MYPDRDDMFTREELVAAQQAEEAIRVTVEFYKKGEPPDRDEIRTVPEEAKQLLLQFETLVVKDELLYRRFVHRTFPPSDPPRESTSVPVPIAQFEQMDDSDDPAPVIGPAYVGHKWMKPSDVTEAQVNGKTVPVIGQ